MTRANADQPADYDGSPCSHSACLPERDITIQIPDSRWQALKSSLARWWPLRWLKVRWRVYTTRGVPHLDPETGVITVSTTSPIAVTTITKRGKP